MKRIIATTLITLLLSVINLSAQEVKATYIIDGQKVEIFDGSQLTGKTITSFTVSGNVNVVFTTDYNGQTPNSVKVITSTNPNKDVTVEANGVISVNECTIVYVIDGKVTSSEKFKSMPSSNIESVSIIKFKDDPEFKKYAKANTEAVIMLSTKK